jgi:hypothetical protein
MNIAKVQLHGIVDTHFHGWSAFGPPNPVKPGFPPLHHNTQGRAEDDILLAFNFNTFLHMKTAENLKFASLWTKFSLFVCFGKHEVSETIFPTV